MVFLRLVLLAAMVLCLTEVPAQQPMMRHYTVRDGLVQSQVNHLFQDSRGYIWISTRAGLSRFDGSTFHNYTIGSGLPGNWVTAVFEWPDGRIFGTTRQGIFRVEPDTIIALESTGKELLSPLFVFSHFEMRNDGKAAFFAMDAGGICLIQFDGQDVTRIPIGLPQSRPMPRLANCAFDRPTGEFLAQDSSGVIYHVSDNRLLTLTTKTGFKLWSRGKGGTGAAGITDLQGRVYQYQEGKLKPTTRFVSPLNDIKGDRYLIGGLAGRYYGMLDTLLMISTPGASPEILPVKEHITAYLLDEEENLWLGTENGLMKFPGFFFRKFQPDGLLPNVWAASADKNGNVWLAGLQGLVQVYDFRNFRLLSAWNRPVKGQLHFFPHSICDSRGNQWFNSNPTGMIQYDSRGFRNYLPSGHDKADGYFLLEDTLHKRIIGSSHLGLNLVYEDGSRHLIPNREISPESFSIISMLIDRQGRYWLGGFRGLRFWDGKEKFYSPPADVFGNDFKANALVMDKKGNVWSGSFDGLYHYHDGVLRKIPVKGISNLVTSLCISRDSILLIGGIEGIALLNLNRFYAGRDCQICFYNHLNGFDGQEIGQNAMCTDPGGRVWIPANDGMYLFYPDWFHVDTTLPKVHFTELSVLDGLMRWQPLPGLQPGSIYRIARQMNNIRFGFNGINHSHPNQVQFRYYLEGFDNDWSQPVNEHHAVYTNLGPGRYVFRIQAANEFGMWSEAETGIVIEIIPALWQRLWFQIVLAILVLSLIGIVPVVWLNRRRKLRYMKIRSELQVLDLQLKTIRSQMEPHFTFNAINAIGGAIIKNDKDTALKYLQRLSKLIRATLVSSTQITRSLEKEIEFLTHYLEIEQFRFDDKFEYEINVGENVDLRWHVPKMVLHTYVENAVKHGIIPSPAKGMIKVDIRLEQPGTLVLRIHDNGPGFRANHPESELSTHMGLKIMEQYFELVYQRSGLRIQSKIETLKDAAGQATGTCVTVVVPVRLCIQFMNGSGLR
jgi:ligand-binding sensor domain-containing protein